MSGTPTTEYVHYIRGGSQAIAVVKRISGSLQTRYLHRDHLGSVVALTDSAGAIVERNSYDPWGKRRDPASWVTPAPGTFSFDPSYSDRGFTGHEHVDHLGLINMNGRIYDPELGRFLSADPTTQFPESTQGWNRYTYGGNNPLSYTDPSGFSLLKTLMSVAGIALNFIPVVGTFASIAWYNAMLVGFASGFLASGGNLKAGLLGAIGGAAFFGVGFISNQVLRVLSHGLVNGALSELAGGNFGSGFASGVAGALGGLASQRWFGKPGTGGTLATIERTMVAAVAGGVGSAAGGGKFENGAKSSAFAHLYNDELPAHAINHRELMAAHDGLVKQAHRVDRIDSEEEFYTQFPGLGRPLGGDAWRADQVAVITSLQREAELLLPPAAAGVIDKVIETVSEKVVEMAGGKAIEAAVRLKYGERAAQNVGNVLKARDVVLGITGLGGLIPPVTHELRYTCTKEYQGCGGRQWANSSR